MCTATAVTLPFDVEEVLFFFCKGRLCEIAPRATGTSPFDAKRVENILSQKYGEPRDPPDFISKCRDPERARVAFRRAWFWAPPEPAMLRLIYDCADAKNLSIHVYYDDPEGAAWRMRQAKERDSNF